MAKQTITQYIESMLLRYNTKEDFKADLDNLILDLDADKPYNRAQAAFYRRVRNKYEKLFGSVK